MKQNETLNRAKYFETHNYQTHRYLLPALLARLIMHVFINMPPVAAPVPHEIICANSDRALIQYFFEQFSKRIDLTDANTFQLERVIVLHCDFFFL